MQSLDFEADIKILEEVEIWIRTELINKMMKFSKKMTLSVLHNLINSMPKMHQIDSK